MVLKSLIILVPSPCAKLPISFMFAILYSCLLFSFRRAVSLSIWLAAGSITAPANRKALVVVLGWLCGSYAPCLVIIAAAYA